MSTTSEVVTQSDINNLAQKLDQLSEVLSEKERTLLLAIFKLAGNALSAKVGAGGAGTSAGGGSQTESGISRAQASSIGIGIGDSGAASRASELSRGFASAFTAVGPSSLVVDKNIAAGGVGIGIIW